MRNSRATHIEDRDGISLNQLDGYFDNEIKQYSQELRLTHSLIRWC